MLIWLFRYLKGFVRIRVLGYSPERFLNLCKARHIVLWDLQNVGNEYEMNLSIRDLRKIRPLVKKARAHVTVTERHGLPFFLHRNRKRKMFPVGMLACCMLLYVLSLFIWDIRIEGNRARSTDVLLTYLAEEQIVHGMRKRDVDCKEIQTMLRIHFPDLTWVSARVTGTQLLIRVRENQDLETEQQEAANTSESSDLVAARAGIITGILVRSGTAQVQPGDEVEAGTVLISGTVDIRDDSGEAVGVQEVCADGDVRARTFYIYEDSFARSHEVRYFTGKKRYGVSIRAGRKLLSFTDPRTFPLYTTVETEHPLHLTGNFYLPLSFGLIERAEYEVYTEKYTAEEAKGLAEAHLNEFLNNLLQKGVQIVGNDVKIDNGRNFCVSKGKIEVLEEIGILKNRQKEQAAFE